MAALISGKLDSERLPDGTLLGGGNLRVAGRQATCD